MFEIQKLKLDVLMEKICLLQNKERMGWTLIKM